MCRWISMLCFGKVRRALLFAVTTLQARCFDFVSISLLGRYFQRRKRRGQTVPRGDTSDYGFPGFSTTGICQKGCVSCRRASRKTVTTGHTLGTSQRKMPKIFSTLPPFCSNVCTPNLSVFGLLRSGDVKEGILMHNKGVKLSILRHHGPCVWHVPGR